MPSTLATTATPTGAQIVAGQRAAELLGERARLAEPDLDVELLLDQLLENFSLSRIKDPIFYIASDDIQYCKDVFRAYDLDFLCSENFVQFSELAEQDQLTCDLAGLSVSDMMIASNSTFSMCGALLNDSGRVFLRTTRDHRLVPFDPTNTVISLGQ